ncbi:ArsR/SmtB family transcription factor [Tropicibacter sp. S64]|uniref:ArsR/SmtB family transcription factor n=1 Tax=Tropicibacter sp. S64 TaxID=3415122 RepID=UPI003C7A74C7
MAKHEGTLDALFTALGNPVRREILTRLARSPATTSELAAPHDIALPSLMGHLSKLEAAGLVTSQKTGRQRTYALAPDAFSPAQNWFDEQRALWKGRLDRFDDYVTRLYKERAHGPRSKD